jgi:RNA polymerase sigma-70 factor (ECF subfamily)
MGFTKAISKTLVATPERQLEADADLDVVKKVQAGDVTAFDQLMLKYRERVYSVIYNLCANREDAADLTQTTFIKAFQSINRFQGQASFFTWLYRIGVNATLTHLRKNRLRTFFSFERVTEEDKSSELIDALCQAVAAGRTSTVPSLADHARPSFQFIVSSYLGGFASTEAGRTPAAGVLGRV